MYTGIYLQTDKLYTDIHREINHRQKDLHKLYTDKLYIHIYKLDYVEAQT